MSGLLCLVRRCKFRRPLDQEALEIGRMTALSPAEKLRIAFDLHETGRRMYLQTLRRKHRGLSEEQLEAKLLQWLLAPPGGENGDFPGPRSGRFA
ncbi:hypothetical protein AB0K52_18985 [Glycomyces sp. NPDC049804]|uniref:hypothetical protein n=1 Tax=Glycomyces sp. NPDC049804 TaxID=3154363 RepID=UPI00342FA947